MNHEQVKKPKNNKKNPQPKPNQYNKVLKYNEIDILGTPTIASEL